MSAESRAIGERCVAIARQVRDGEYPRDTSSYGTVVAEYLRPCLSCGCDVTVTEYEHAIIGGHCSDCHQRISQEIYEHECRLLSSGYYG